jgi:hypothetical protein
MKPRDPLAGLKKGIRVKAKLTQKRPSLPATQSNASTPRPAPRHQAKADDNEAPEARPKPLPPAEGKIEAYFDCTRGGYYARNNHGEYQDFPKTEFSYKLRQAGFFSGFKHDNGLSYLEAEMLRICDCNSVHFAGPLGGFDAGRYDMAGSRILVTRGPTFIKEVQKPFPHLSKFFRSLLGDQMRYFFGWLKWALSSLRRGLPWSSGQMLAVAGPPGSGKTFLQSLITPMLGGRVSSPYAFMSQGTAFNAEIFGAEHGLIGDQNHATDMKSRRAFGSAIKNLVVEKAQFIHGKGKTGITLFPFIRLSLTLNSNPEAMLVLPPLDSDVKDKIILLKATPVDFPFPSKQFPDSQAYYNTLVAELPGFLHWLRRWRIPPTIADQRYGVVSYHDPELLQGVDDLSPESRLWQTIESYLFVSDVVEFWEGTALDLERTLREKLKPGEVDRLLPFNTACGVYLATLARKMPDRIKKREIGKNRSSYLILKE